MKILQVIPYLNLKKGGDVNVCINISKELAAKGHQVTIICSDFAYDPILADSLKEFNLNVIPFHYILNLSLFLYTPEMRKWLNLNLKDFDIIHSHDFRTYQNVLIHRLSKKNKVPYILHPHGSIPRSVEKKGLKVIYDLFWGYRIMRKASKIISVSKKETEYAKKMGSESSRISLIYNGIDVVNYIKLPEKGKFRKKIGIEGRILLYIGRIHKSKGIDFAIKSFARVTRDFKDLKMIICGPDDGYLQNLKSLVNRLNLNDKVRFIGFIDEENKPSAYVDADLFFHTVLYMGGVGLGPLEALLCNTPVIVTPECSEIVEAVKAGYVVNYGEIDDLSRIIREILSDSSEAKVMAERGRNHIMSHFSWDKVIEQFISTYQEVINGRDRN